MGVQEELSGAALEAAIQRTYVAHTLDQQPLPAVATLPVRGRGRMWFKLEHAALSIMRHNKFTATFQYYSTPEIAGEYPHITAGTRRTLLVRGMYKVKKTDILLKPHAEVHRKLPRNIHAQYLDGILWLGHEVILDGVMHQLSLEMRGHTAWP